MKFHDTLINRIISLSETYGGHRDEHLLREALKRLNISIYTRRSGERILVEQEELDKHQLNR